MTDVQWKVTWIDGHRLPRAPPDQQYPNGIDVDLSRGASVTCTRSLPYPAERCGMYAIVCERCGLRVAITTAGRIDDPRSAKLACKLN
jgi:hypothetical protein